MESGATNSDGACRKLTAKTAAFQVDEYATIFGFADDPLDTKRYVMLQMANKPDEQDIRLNMGGVYIEIDDQIFSGYDIVEDITHKDREITIKIKDICFDKSNTPGIILIEYVGPREFDNTSLENAINVFRSRILAWSADPRNSGATT